MNDALPGGDRGFFMSLRDLAFWTRSARSDYFLSRCLGQHPARTAFDMLYRTRTDPWGSLSTSYRYQQRKHRILLSLIPSRRFDCALDIGCGLGVFTRQLSEITDSVLGIDISEVAVQEATGLTGDAGNVRYECAEFFELEGMARGSFDLIVAVDVLYYLPGLNDEPLKSVRAVVEDLLAPGGVLLLANHFFFELDRPSRLVRRLHEAFRWSDSLQLLTEQRYPFFLASLFEKRLSAPELNPIARGCLRPATNVGS